MKVLSPRPRSKMEPGTQSPKSLSPDRPVKSLWFTWPGRPPTEDPLPSETTPTSHPNSPGTCCPTPIPSRYLCCRQCRSWDVTPAPQLREHAVHLVHSPHQ